MPKVKFTAWYESKQFGEKFKGFANPIKKVGSNLWLKYEIKTMTDEFNRRYKDAIKTGKGSEQFQQYYDILLERAGTSGKGHVLGYGVSNKTHDALVGQYQALRGFLNKDVWSAEAEKIRSDEEIDRWRQFNQNQVLNWDFAKWRKMVDVFGSLSSDILTAFGYEDKSAHKGSETKSIGIPGKDNKTNKGDRVVSNASLMRAFSAGYKKNVDMFTLINKVYNDGTGKGKTTSKLIDDLWEELKKKGVSEEDIDD